MNKPEPEWDTKYSILLNRVNEHRRIRCAEVVGYV